MAVTRAENLSWRGYDGFEGPGLDPALWEPATSGPLRRVEPDANTTVEGGILTVGIPRFTASDSENQMLDNTKHLIFSTRGFDLPATGIARFGVDLAVHHVGVDSGDYRKGVAAFNVVDVDGGTHMVFDVLATREQIFAEHEILGVPGEENPFTRVVNDPFFPPAAIEFRSCCIEFDRSAGRVTWEVDGHTLHEASGLEVLPGSVRIGFGFFTLPPVGLGENSCQGQGGRASWRNFRFSEGGAGP